MGGSFWNWGNGTTLTTNGNTGVSIDGGSTFTGMIVGGSWRGSTWTAEDARSPARQHWRQRHRHPWGGDLPGRHLQGRQLRHGRRRRTRLSDGRKRLWSRRGRRRHHHWRKRRSDGGGRQDARTQREALEPRTSNTQPSPNLTKSTLAEKGLRHHLRADRQPGLTKTGAGDLKLRAGAAEAETILGGITEGISIMEGSLNLSGADGSHMKGTLNIAAGSRLTGSPDP